MQQFNNEIFMKVLKFGAVWCSGCLVMKPRWKEIESIYPWLKTEYYDFDNDKSMVEKYRIDDRLPAFVFLNREGGEILRKQGEIDKEELLKIIDEYRDQ